MMNGLRFGKGANMSNRYTDCRGQRKIIYHGALRSLRKRANEIEKQRDGGLDFESGQITVPELLKKRISLKQGVRCNPKAGYGFVLSVINEGGFRVPTHQFHPRVGCQAMVYEAASGRTRVRWLVMRTPSARIRSFSS